MALYGYRLKPMAAFMPEKLNRGPDALRKTLVEAARSTQPTTPQYTEGLVLFLNWAANSAMIGPAKNQFLQVCEQDYGFTPDSFEIPLENPQDALEEKLRDVKALYGRRENCLILVVVYGYVAMDYQLGFNTGAMCWGPFVNNITNRLLNNNYLNWFKVKRFFEQNLKAKVNYIYDYHFVGPYFPIPSSMLQHPKAVVDNAHCWVDLLNLGGAHKGIEIIGGNYWGTNRMDVRTGFLIKFVVETLKELKGAPFTIAQLYSSIYSKSYRQDFETLPMHICKADTPSRTIYNVHSNRAIPVTSIAMPVCGTTASRQRTIPSAGPHDANVYSSVLHGSTNCESLNVNHGAMAQVVGGSPPPASEGPSTTPLRQLAPFVPATTLAHDEMQRDGAAELSECDVMHVAYDVEQFMSTTIWASPAPSPSRTTTVVNCPTPTARRTPSLQFDLEDIVDFSQSPFHNADIDSEDKNKSNHSSPPAAPVETITEHNDKSDNDTVIMPAKIDAVRDATAFCASSESVEIFTGDEDNSLMPNITQHDGDDNNTTFCVVPNSEGGTQSVIKDIADDETASNASGSTVEFILERDASHPHPLPPRPAIGPSNNTVPSNTDVGAGHPALLPLPTIPIIKHNLAVVVKTPLPCPEDQSLVEFSAQVRKEYPALLDTWKEGFRLSGNAKLESVYMVGGGVADQVVVVVVRVPVEVWTMLPLWHGWSFCEVVCVGEED
ncbi:hypothetical protein GQ43DRAFT_445099 [Delitschia confertaspora ATCC 74209]|uniref:Uncharacterized protein n=1 Tax=Delitschia confertaspora ATCC 74209 TaxID=1513339 RepID=A0A9P4MQY4_9PLEO|nr:hypothetical protein GQ43DRAFT_445099 [Delitschia confertaspora ATCC 74209]